jgi:hypothetical protein
MNTISEDEQREWQSPATRHGLRIMDTTATLYGRALDSHRLIGFATLVATAKESL